MAETARERLDRLKAPPRKPVDAALGTFDPALLEHATYSLWRIAEAMEEANRIASTNDRYRKA